MARVLARLRSRAIDDMLLAGETPNGNPVARARLARLLDLRYRSKLAGALRRLLEVAERRQLSPYLAQLPLQVQDVLDTEPLILTLAAELEEAQAGQPARRDPGRPAYPGRQFSDLLAK